MSILPPASAADQRPSCHVALIFDDGPVPAQAEKYLALFAREGIHVTFAYVAQNARQQPATARAVQAAGHEIVNHSFSHLHPGELDDAALAHEIVDAQHVLAGVLGAAPRWYWPPFLEGDERMPALLARAGIERYEPRHLRSSDDWNREVGADEIQRRATTGIVDDTVILCHEWREETLARMPAMLAELRRQGCVFLTFSELARHVRANAS